MAKIETATVSITGIFLGLSIVIACVGTYSFENIGTFDFIVNEFVFFGSIIFSFIFSMIAGILPAYTTIGNRKCTCTSEL